MSEHFTEGFIYEFLRFCSICNEKLPFSYQERIPVILGKKRTSSGSNKGTPKTVY